METPMRVAFSQKLKTVLAIFLGITSILTVGSKKNIEFNQIPPELLASAPGENEIEFSDLGNNISPPDMRNNRPEEVITGSLCLNRGEVPEEEYHWLYVPVRPEELHTEVDYLFLAGQLIQYHVVDASSCPSAGLSENGYANACGMAEARDIVYQMQNLYDDEILDAWETVGVPPVMLKQQIRYESQFWPSQYGMYHYGLGHVTYTGAHTGLLWSPVLYEITCNKAYNGNCEGHLIDDVMIGTLLGMMNASCTTCEWKVDIPKAEQSIFYLAHTLLAFCRQTSQTIYNATDRTNPSQVVSYATLWKLTLFNYNVGPNCLYEAVAETNSEIEGKFTWNDFATYVYDDSCERGVDYVNNITRRFYDFSP